MRIFIIAVLLLIPTLANAQPKFPFQPKAVDLGPPVTSSLCDPILIFKGITPQNFVARIKACGDEDLNNAIADANTLPTDYGALACLNPVKVMRDAIVKGGVLTGFQGFRRAKQNGLITGCLNYITSTVAP